MKLEADLHVHTVASGHAFSTVEEIVKAARLKGLKGIGLTDHGPALPGGAHPYHFWNQRVFPREMEGVRIFRGAEANIVNLKGEIDLDEEILESLDLVLVAFHLFCGYEGKSKSENTKALIKAMENPFVDGVVHPGNPIFPIEAEEVVKVAKEKDIFLELNNSSFLENTSRKGSYQNDLRIAKLALENDLEIIISSDAHLASAVGEFGEAIKVARQAGFIEEKILNSSLEKVHNFLIRKGKNI